jgi:CheY-like chemotaxis protein
MAKLLLVEDDNNLREIYEARLQAEGYTIVSAKDGEEALVVAKAEKPDLVIADVMMPKISGFEMLDIMRNTDELKDVKVIMLTALGQSDDQQRADKLGADRYLVKSQVTLEDIVKVTHELLESDAAPGVASTAPAPEPAAEPAPAPAAKPEPEPAPDASASDAAAKSTVQEEADVEAKIEDFVAGASSEPTTPASSAPAPADSSASPVAPAVEPKPEPATPPAKPAAAPTDDTKSADSASDDKLMADAVEKLVANTDDKDEAKDKEPAGDAAPSAPQTPAVTPTVIPVSIAPDDKPDDDEPAKPEPDKEEGKKEDGTDLVGGNRVIKPLESSEHKKDIKQLLAEEDAKEAQTVPGNVIVGGTKSEDPEDKPAGQSQPIPGSTPPASGVDPNSIAL